MESGASERVKEVVVYDSSEVACIAISSTSVSSISAPLTTFCSTSSCDSTLFVSVGKA